MGNNVDISSIITVAVALSGWFIVHRLSAWRDRSNHKRKMQTDFLVTALRNLANSANRPYEKGAIHLKDLECAVVDIQLFGSKQQVQLAQDFAAELAEAGHASPDPLINSLRQDLRKELGYEQINGNVRWLRVDGGVNDAKHHASCDRGHGRRKL